MEDCIFCKIARGDIPKEFIYEDKDVMVFPDINPARPVHLLIVPKKHVAEFVSLDDAKLRDKLFSTVQKMIKDQKIQNRQYRLVINGGGAQVINHLHIHLLSNVGEAAQVQ